MGLVSRLDVMQSRDKEVMFALIDSKLWFSSILWLSTRTSLVLKVDSWKINTNTSYRMCLPCTSLHRKNAATNKDGFFFFFWLSIFNKCWSVSHFWGLDILGRVLPQCSEWLLQITPTTTPARSAYFHFSHLPSSSSCFSCECLRQR